MKVRETRRMCSDDLYRLCLGYQNALATLGLLSEHEKWKSQQEG